MPGSDVLGPGGDAVTRSSRASGHQALEGGGEALPRWFGASAAMGGEYSVDMVRKISYLCIFQWLTPSQNTKTLENAFLLTLVR